MCVDFKVYLNLEIVCHISSSRKYSVYYKNLRFASWDFWKKYITETYSNIDDQNSLYLKIKIRITDKECIKRGINGL